MSVSCFLLLAVKASLLIHLIVILYLFNPSCSQHSFLLNCSLFFSLFLPLFSVIVVARACFLSTSSGQALCCTVEGNRVPAIINVGSAQARFHLGHFTNGKSQVSCHCSLCLPQGFTAHLQQNEILEFCPLGNCNDPQVSQRLLCSHSPD